MPETGWPAGPGRGPGLMGTVQAAGGVLWRPGSPWPEIALVHRPRRGDWSLPKGKSLGGEHLLVTAVREVTEETGYEVRLGPFVTRVGYQVTTADGTRPKEVSYWSMRPVAGEFAPNDEVDELAWMPIPEAVERLTYPLDRAVLHAFDRVPGWTSTVVVVRALRRADGSGEPRSPHAGGAAGTAPLTPVLAATSVRSLVSGPEARCRRTLAGYAEQEGLDIRVEAGLGDPAAPALYRTADELLRGADLPLAVCVRGRTVPTLVSALVRGVGGVPPSDPGLPAGGWWSIHLVDRRAVAVERYRP